MWSVDQWSDVQGQVHQECAVPYYRGFFCPIKVHPDRTCAALFLMF